MAFHYECFTAFAERLVDGEWLWGGRFPHSKKWSEDLFNRLKDDLRGLPLDCCGLIRGHHDGWGNEKHGVSWSTLSELEDKLEHIGDPVWEKVIGEVREAFPEQTDDHLRLVYWFSNERAYFQ